MALSDDLRTRVVESVLSGGLSRNAAARRFKVSVASAVRWVKQFETTGEISPKACGGDRRSSRIEAHHAYLMGLIRRTPDITLLEIEERLINNCGERFSSSVLWRFFDASRRDAQKKSAHAAEQQRPDVLKRRLDGLRASPISIPESSFSLMRPAPPPIWRANADVAGGDEGCAPPSRTAIIRRSRSSPACVLTGLRRRRSSTGRSTPPLRGMGGAMSRPDTLERRHCRYGQSCPPIKGRGSKNSSRPPTPNCAICRPTAPT